MLILCPLANPVNLLTDTPTVAQPKIIVVPAVKQDLVSAIHSLRRARFKVPQALPVRLSQVQSLLQQLFRLA